jgi:hypothetical protein
MKDLVRLPAAFLLSFLLLFVAILAVSLLSAWGGLLPASPPDSPEARTQALATALALLPRLARQALPAGALAALLVVLLRIARKPGSRLLSLLLPPACAFAVLVLGYPVLEGLVPASPAAAAPDYLEPQVFTATSSGALYVESLASGRATGVVVLGQAADRRPRLTYFPRAVLQVRADTAALRLGPSAVQWPAQPVYAPLFAAEEPIRPFLQDVGALSARLSRQHAEQRGTFYLSCLGWVLALCGVAVLLRLTPWPLLNVSLTLLAARGLVALFVWLGNEGAAVFGKSLPGPAAGGFVESLPAAALLLLGAVLILVDLLFVPFDREREDSIRA